MLVNIEHDTPAEHRRLFVAGVAYLVVVALLLGLSIAIYQKVFSPVTMVTVKADRAGLQLSKFGDVRLHGVLVGQVRSIRQDGKEAVIKIGLKPNETVYYGKYSGTEVEVEGTKYVILRESDVLGVLE